MPDALTPAEREAIAEAVASGWLFNGEPRQVQIIPRGVSGLPQYAQAFSWAEQIKACFDRGKAIKDGMAKSAAVRHAAKPRMEIIEGETRAETIARLRQQKRTLREIGEFLTISHVTVSKIEKGEKQ